MGVKNHTYLQIAKIHKHLITPLKMLIIVYVFCSNMKYTFICIVPATRDPPKINGASRLAALQTQFDSMSISMGSISASHVIFFFSNIWDIAV